MITVYAGNHMKPINALHGQNAVLLIVKSRDLYNYH
jgi:hypothetical protein